MKDQYFGVEVEMTGITRERAAQALADYFGTSPRKARDYYGSWYVKDTAGKEWRFMYDSSIRTERRADGSHQHITPHIVERPRAGLSPLDGQGYEGGSLFPNSHYANRAKSLALRQFQTFRANRAERFECGGHETYGPAKRPCHCRGLH